MSITARRLRGLLLALGILTLSATVVFAGAASGKASGLAAAHPVAATESEQPDATAGDTDTQTESKAPDTTDTSSSGNACNIDLTQAPSALSGYSHGELVCSAAHETTPAGYANHGAWVKTWAKFGKGGNAPTTPNTNGTTHRG